MLLLFFLSEYIYVQILAMSILSCGSMQHTGNDNGNGIFNLQRNSLMKVN